MKKSLIPHILVAAFLLVGAVLWIWLISSIDYSKLNARTSAPDSAEVSEQQPGAAPQADTAPQAAPAPQTEAAPQAAPQGAPAQ